MSNNINSVFVNGRLTEDPKLYETRSENLYALLRLAINRRIGEDKKQTIYYDVKVCVNGHREFPRGGHPTSPPAATTSPHRWPSVLPA